MAGRERSPSGAAAGTGPEVAASPASVAAGAGRLGRHRRGRADARLLREPCAVARPPRSVRRPEGRWEVVVRRGRRPSPHRRAKQVDVGGRRSTRHRVQCPNHREGRQGGPHRATRSPPNPGVALARVRPTVRRGAVGTPTPAAAGTTTPRRRASGPNRAAARRARVGDHRRRLRASRARCNLALAPDLRR